MPIGSLNPCPFRPGGGPTNAAKAYGLIRRAVGTGGSAANDLGIDGLWRRSRAKGLAAASSCVRRAALQFFPHLATDLVPAYERLHHLYPVPCQTLEERRQEVVARHTANPSAIYSALEAELDAIDPRWSIMAPLDQYAITTQHGRAFGALPGASEDPVYGGYGFSHVPAYSTRAVCYLRFTLGHAGAPTPTEEALFEAARRLVRKRLPSWCTFEITTTAGFVIGASLIGYCGVTDP